MTSIAADDVRTAFETLRQAIAAALPAQVDELRPPVSFEVPWRDQAGAEQVLALWSLTSGQADGMLGVCGGLRLLGPHDSEAERAKWSDLLEGDGLAAEARPAWDESTSLDPDAVRAVYYAAGWIPVFCEPLEANYLAVDLVPLAGGRAGQIVLCGRDEESKCVVAPDLASLLGALAADCRAGGWDLETAESRKGPLPYVARADGRLLSACRDRDFPRP